MALAFNSDVNYVAILVSAIIYMVLGALWYSPLLFKKTWLSYTGLREEDIKGEGVTYFLAFIVALVISYVLALFIQATQALTALQGALVGFWAWLGFIVTTHFSGVIWEKRPFNLYLIQVVYLLIVLVISGALLAVWR